MSSFTNCATYASATTARPALPGAQGYQPGELFPVLGVDYPLTLTPTARPDLQFNGAVFCMSARAHPRASLLFERWYRRHARAEFTRRVAHLAGQHGFQPGSVRISSARTRWGSCSASGTLSFAWRLVMAPPEIIDYVIIHELCHLRQRNHSPAFWTLVTGLLPNYRLQRDWLKINGARLGLAPAGASETTR